MILNIQEKYNQLTLAQKEIFSGYGLRQVKHFVELSLPSIEAVLPQGAIVQGINSNGRLQAYDPEKNIHYLWISDLSWQETQQFTQSFDRKEDFLAIWKGFELADQALIELSHIHRDFLEMQTLKS